MTTPPIDKRELLRLILAALEAELEGYARSARAAHAEATDEQSKAENKYDTRGLEASYLARGQSRQAAEVAEAIQLYRALEVRDFGSGAAADLGALVVLADEKGRELYFLGPRAGGLEVSVEKETVLIITPQSPLGQQLVGKRAGDRFQLALGRLHRACRVLAVA